MDAYLQGLFSLANDSTADIRKLVLTELRDLCPVDAFYGVGLGLSKKFYIVWLLTFACLLVSDRCAVP